MLQNTYHPSHTLALTLIPVLQLSLTDPVLQSSLTDPATLNVLRHANQGGAVFILEKYILYPVAFSSLLCYTYNQQNLSTLNVLRHADHGEGIFYPNEIDS